MSASPASGPPRTMMEVFKHLPEGTLVQLIENNLVMSPSPLDVHQKVLAEIGYQLLAFIKQHQLGEVRYRPYDVYLDNENAFEPDIVFISNENVHKIKANGFYGAPDLVIEILSPSTARYDRTQKKAVYERCGVQEYWIVDTATKKAEGFVPVKGRFLAQPAAIGIIRSALLGTTLTF